MLEIAPIRTAAPAGNRRHPTLLDAREVEVVAFAIDLRNSTARLSGLHPYDILSILGAYQSLVRRRIEAAGGHIVSLAGDGVMAIFLADRDDGANRRALDVASKIASALPTLSQRLPDRTAPLQAGIGIHRGLGLIGIGPTDGTLHFFGEPANVASRLEAATKPFGGGTAISSDDLPRPARPPALPDPQRTDVFGRRDRSTPFCYATTPRHHKQNAYGLAPVPGPGTAVCRTVVPAVGAMSRHSTAFGYRLNRTFGMVHPASEERRFSRGCRGSVFALRGRPGRLLQRGLICGLVLRSEGTAKTDAT